MASNLPFRVTLAAIAITLAVIQSDGLRLAVMEAQGNGRIAFKIDINDNSEIYVMDSDGSNQVNLTNNPATDSLPSWSPDGSKIAFNSDRSQPGEPEIFVMDADGSNQTGLTNNTATDVAPSWSPDGSKIAFTSRRDGNCGPLCEEIYVMDADGSNPTRLTNNGERDTSPSWSPDGTRIAFISTRTGQGTFDAFVMDADGGNPTRLTTDSNVNSVRWFPGASIVFTSNLDTDFEIYLIEADGTNLDSLVKSLCRSN